MVAYLQMQQIKNNTTSDLVGFHLKTILLITIQEFCELIFFINLMSMVNF